MDSSIQMYVISPCTYVHIWSVLICIYVVCPLMYEYKQAPVVQFIIIFSIIVRFSRHTQGNPVNANIIWMYLMKNQEQLKTTQSP